MMADSLTNHFAGLAAFGASQLCSDECVQACGFASARREGSRASEMGFSTTAPGGPSPTPYRPQLVPIEVKQTNDCPILGLSRNYCRLLQVATILRKMQTTRCKIVLEDMQRTLFEITQ